MKKVVLILFFLFILGCSSGPSEVLRIADSTDISLEFREISDKDTMIQIQKIVDGLVWVDEAIETNGNPDYSFWLKRENEELRITNYEVWFSSDGSVVIDHIKVKFAYIEGSEKDELKDYLKKRQDK